MKPKLPQKLFALMIATSFFTTGFAQTATWPDDYIGDRFFTSSQADRKDYHCEEILFYKRGFKIKNSIG